MEAPTALEKVSYHHIGSSLALPEEDRTLPGTASRSGMSLFARVGAVRPSTRMVPTATGASRPGRDETGGGRYASRPKLRSATIIFCRSARPGRRVAGWAIYV
jgi:hypothetical protein